MGNWGRTEPIFAKAKVNSWINRSILTLDQHTNLDQQIDLNQTWKFLWKKTPHKTFYGVVPNLILNKVNHQGQDQ